MYFKNCTNLEELKKEYRKLCLKYHPDRNKNTDTTKIMQEINAEYEKTFKVLQVKSNNKHEQEENVYDFMEIIQKIINLNINIEICGVYIWISGNTFAVKEQLKQAGFYWASTKKMWYWKPEEVTSGKHKAWDMDKIRNKFGSQILKESGNMAALA